MAWKEEVKNRLTSAVQTRAVSPSCGVLEALGPPILTADVKPQMHPSKPTLNRFLSDHVLAFQIIALLLLSLAALLIFVLSGASRFNRAPVSPIVFGHLAVPTSTDANFVWVAFTNQSKFAVSYLTEPLQVSSNGIWSGPPSPPRQRLTKLLAGQSGMVVIDAAATNRNARVPVLWGYGYTPGATHWQQLREDFLGRVCGRGGRGFLYTNYLTNLKL